MKKLVILFVGLLIALCGFAQETKKPLAAKVMTLGVFHFTYPNLDAVTTDSKDQISVLDEPYHSQIVAIAKAIEEFKPTIIAVERSPSYQCKLDSLFRLYKDGRFVLGKDEVFQLGFRIGKDLNLPRIYCVDEWGRHYPGITSVFEDTPLAKKFDDFDASSPDSIFLSGARGKSGKVESVVDELYSLNRPDNIRKDLSAYLLGSFKFEDKPNDFFGVDFQTGRWFNRNLRILRNIQRIPFTPNDRILVIFGAGHLNLLNIFFDASEEFDLVSPLPYLKKAGASVGKKRRR